MKFLQGHWIGRKWCGDAHDQKGLWNCTAKKKGTAIQRDWSSCLQKHQCSESWNLEAKERQISVNQLCACGAVANWCHQFALTEEEKGHVGIVVDKKKMTMVEPEEMKLLESLPTQAPGNTMQGGAFSFQTLENRYSLHNSVQKLSSNIL